MLSNMYVVLYACCPICKLSCIYVGQYVSRYQPSMPSTLITFVSCILAAMLADANLRPFSVSPQVMASLVKNLFLIKPGKF